MGASKPSKSPAYTNAASVGESDPQEIEAFASSWQQPQPQEIEPVEKSVEPQAPMPDANDVQPLKKQRTSVGLWQTDLIRLESIFDRLGLDPHETYINRMSLLLQWVDQQLGQNTEQEPEPAIAQTPTLLTKPQEPTAIDNHEQAPVSTRLEAKLDRLTDVMTLLVETQLKVASSPQVSPPPAIAPKPNRDRSTRSADEKVNQAIDKLIEYNNQPGLLHTDKWQIGISVLKKLIGYSQAVINYVLHQRQDELLKHHQSHQLTPTHNHFHRGKTQVTNVIPI